MLFTTKKKQNKRISTKTQQSTVLRWEPRVK